MKDGFTTFVVNLRVRSCVYNYWVLIGLPCKHICACIAYKRDNVEAYCDAFYSKATFVKTDSEIIHPMPEVDERATGGFTVTIDPPS